MLTEKEIAEMHDRIQAFQRMKNTITKDTWGQQQRDDSFNRLIEAYTLCIEKGMFLSCDDQWTLRYIPLDKLRALEKQWSYYEFPIFRSNDLGEILRILRMV